MIRVAFATSAGRYVDEHFGHAPWFDIYDVARGGSKRVERRPSSSFTRFSPEGTCDDVPTALYDCDAVFVVRIGKGPAAALVSQGKRVFEVQGPIDDIISHIVEGPLLADLEESASGTASLSN